MLPWVVLYAVTGWLFNHPQFAADERPGRRFAAAEAIGIPFPDNYPVFGSDAFETATGVHAAAVVKAFKKGDAWLADRVYSGVPAGMFGLEQRILVGPMSGKSNVSWVLEQNGVDATDETVQRVLEVAKKSSRNLTDSEVVAAAKGA